MFILGFITGVLLMSILVWLLDRTTFTPITTTPQHPQQAIRDIEHQTIHALLAAELQARAEAATTQPDHPSNGTARDIRRPQP